MKLKDIKFDRHDKEYSVKLKYMKAESKRFLEYI